MTKLRHHRSRREMLASLAGLGPLLLLPNGARAQGYPDKPIRLVVPFAPGGTSDLISRIIASSISAHLNGQSVIVENKAGAGGALGAGETARSKPDGYSLGTATVSTIATVPAVQPTTPYDPLTDFTPIVNVAATPNVIAVHPSFPAKDFKGFVEELKRSPGKYFFASSGTGGINHLLMEIFKSLSGTDVTHIPYRGSGPALNDVVGGQVTMIYDQISSTMPHLQAGTLVPIVVTGPKRLQSLPNIPTLGEVGFGEANRVAFYGIYGPKGLPRDVVDKVNAAVRKALADPTVRERIEQTASIPIGNTPEEFAAEIKAELAVYKKIVAEKGIKPE